MSSPKSPFGHSGAREVRDIRTKSNHLILMVFVFSAVVNALMLTGPIYMLQVYD
ncbi:hypothetical protein HA378_33760, partial [Escherichia coli]|nr:hypothetical protein [Escherichia coli]